MDAGTENALSLSAGPGCKEVSGVADLKKGIGQQTRSTIRDRKRNQIIMNTETGSVVALNSQSFDNAIAQGTTLVDFWAPWCGPCRMQLPILEELASAVGEGVTIGKVNVDECPDLAARFAVRSIPTLVLFKEGEPVKQFIGVQDKSTLLSSINNG
jgi:thioredoxin 1